ncbi:perlucin-like protein, partial [Mercenaria mercenaria]|uniref:perlucin-like protein n=1 Tax=Mercenaria mercenaria TaxID=6596 RepID=UPI00234E461D
SFCYCRNVWRNYKASFLSHLFDIDGAGCPKTWLTFNGNCYSFVDTRLNWFRATNACKEKSAILVDITSTAEDDFVRHTVQHLHAHEDPDAIGYWISGNDLAVEGHWVWGYPNDIPMAYADWRHGEPNNRDANKMPEDCAILWGRYNYTWNDITCYSEEYYICKQEESHEVVG